MESQNTKDVYKQMLLQEMRSLAADIAVTVVQDSQDEMATSTRSKKDDFYDLKSDDESTPESNVNIEVRSIDNLHKYPLVKGFSCCTTQHCLLAHLLKDSSVLED